MTNSELRKRKVKEHNEKLTGPTGRKRKPKDISSDSIFKSLACLIVSGSLLTLLLVLYTEQLPWHLGHRVIDQVAKQFGHYKPVFAVVIDAGSTGSRVLAYTFHEAYLDSHLVLDKELFEYNKPGLSSFAKEPHLGAQKIAELIEKAKEEIPREYWSKTPLILKATAGLRLLPKEDAHRLLEAVKQLFKKTPFKTNDKSVEIMDGTDEGIYSWFTVNFLLDRINGNPEQTVAALDLGGGSTQVTFSAVAPSSLKETQYIHHAVSPKGPIPVYTHSYLGLGLMTARKEISTFGQGDATNVTSQCVNSQIKDKQFFFHGTEYFVSGPQKPRPIPVVNFTKCSEIISSYVKHVVSTSKPPEELPSKKIFAFSYYYDRASDVGLIDFMTGGQIKVNDFRQKAIDICNLPNHDHPFACLDVTFIWLLLEKGFELDQDTSIYLYKKIDGHEISWALGAAYDVLRG